MTPKIRTEADGIVCTSFTENENIIKIEDSGKVYFLIKKHLDKISRFYLLTKEENDRLHEGKREVRKIWTNPKKLPPIMERDKYIYPVGEVSQFDFSPKGLSHENARDMFTIMTPRRFDWVVVETSMSFSIQIFNEWWSHKGAIYAKCFDVISNGVDICFFDDNHYTLSSHAKKMISRMSNCIFPENMSLERELLKKGVMEIEGKD
jgi:hypothetical protein